MVAVEVTAVSSIASNISLIQDRGGHPNSAEPPNSTSTPVSGSMPSLSHLRREHAELASLARQLGGMIAQSVPPEAGRLYELRMKLTSALIRHLKAEDWVLYPSLLRSSNKRVVITARAFSASMGGLASDFQDYVKRWGAREIGDDWKGYQRETSEILRVLALRMKREDRDLYPLLNDVERSFEAYPVTADVALVCALHPNRT